MPDHAQAHRVEITFEDGVYIKLICPESGCKPVGYCGGCGRDLTDSEITPCYDCAEPSPDDCWLKGWVENLTAEELLHGTITVPVDAEWDGDSAVLSIVEPQDGSATRGS